MSARAWLVALAATAAASVGAAPATPTRQASPAAPATPADPILRCSAQATAPSVTLQLGKSMLLRLAEAVYSRTVGNPAVAQALLVAPDTLYVAGLDVGSTNMIVQGKSGLCSVIEVRVEVDPSGLQAALARLLPEQDQVKVSAAADTLVLSGAVTDAQAMAQVLELAAAFVRRPAQAIRHDGEQSQAATAAPAQSTTVATAAAPGSMPRIVNLLGTSAPQQVMLEVKIAEVSKTLLDKLELGTSLQFGGGSWAGTLLSGFLGGSARSMLALGKAGGNQLRVEAERQDGLIRILAEPTVMAISGQEGSFLAGGKIFIPVAQDNNKITLEEREFGVGLRFTPTVLGGGRINLRVAPEVSELSREGIGISAAGINGGAILPLITTRRATTTVELFDGQSFAIGGLIKNNQTSNIHATPVLGELPVLGALFRSSDFQHDRTELLFIVTPHLVRPLPARYALPTDALAPAERAALLLGGRMEAAPARPASAAPSASSAPSAPAAPPAAPVPAPSPAPAGH